MKQLLFLILIFFTSLSFGQTINDYYHSANRKKELKNFEGAILDYNKVIELDPTYAFSYYNRAEAKLGIQDYKGAIEDYSKNIEIYPDDRMAYYKRGIIKLALGNKEGCLDLKKAKELGLVEVNEQIKEYCN
ncbi:tetratricopeptide repeat protein [Flavobacterium chungnamense]|uniref:Tetratricopeptide repeat protein n=1 Tax=Flavobacterium chungnamense TaxID=706182 RepID=A0ABP7UKG8_9FLAO